MSKWVVERSDGGVSIIDVHDAALEFHGATVAQIVAKHSERWERKHQARKKRGEASTLRKPVKFYPLENEPTDRIFREAWAGDETTKGVKVNMDKARAIHMDRIREVRDKKLQSLDVETMKAVGAGDDTRRAQVEAEKQRLRDIPQTFDLTAAKTPDELKTLWPPDLS